MEDKTLILTSSGLKNLVLNSSLEDEFSFIFSNQSINMKSVFAEFISPLVSKLHHSDPTISTIYFTNELNDISLTQNVLSKFKLISCGESITINEEESNELKIISVLIGNKDLFSKLNDLFYKEMNETNIDQHLDNLTNLSKISPSSYFFDYSNIIEFISSHFYLINKEKLKQLPKPIIYSIISNSKLKLESEDSLFDFINELFETKDKKTIEIIKFYEKVDFYELSEEKFENFLSIFNPLDMTQELWKKLVFCFYNNKCKQNKFNETRYFSQKVNNTNEIKFNGNRSNAFCGIIDSLTKKSGGNVADNGTVIVTSKNHYGDRIDKNAVDLQNTQNYFQINNDPNGWLNYDFVGRKVHPTHYSIRTRHDCETDYPRNWIIEGSNNSNDWTTLDNRQNDCSLNGLSDIHTFDIKEYEGSYRYLRFRQTGSNSGGKSRFYTCLSALEYFGTLIENNK